MHADTRGVELTFSQHLIGQLPFHDHCFKGHVSGHRQIKRKLWSKGVLIKD